MTHESHGCPAHRVIDLRETPHDGDPLLRPYRTAGLLTSDVEILAARRLHAEIFVSSGFVSATDLEPDGTIGARMDPWALSCTYFGVMGEDVAKATVRQIVVGPEDLPALQLTGLVSDEVQRIAELPAGEAVEISGLARRRGTPSSDVIAVYVRMWQESLRARHRVWVMAVDQKVFKMLRSLLCGEAIRQIGPAQEYMGSLVVPAVIWCDELAGEQRRLAASAADATSLRASLPLLFPPPLVEAR